MHEVASLHDQSVKVACAASLGMVDLKVMAECDHLHSVPDGALSPDFIRAYAQVAKFRMWIKNPMNDTNAMSIIHSPLWARLYAQFAASAGVDYVAYYTDYRGA